MFWGIMPYPFFAPDTTSTFALRATCIQNMYNPMLSLGSIGNFYGSALLNPAQAYMNQAAYNKGFLIASNNIFTIRFKTIAQNTAYLGNDINEAIESDKITDAQREELKQLKQELEALVKKQEEFQELRKSNGATYEMIDAKLFELGDDYRAIKAKAEELAERIKADISELEETTDITTDDGTATTDTRTGTVTGTTTGSTTETETGTTTGAATGTEATGQTQTLNKNVDEYTNNNSKYDAEIVFSLTFWGYSGTCRAAFIDKRGVKHTFTARTGMSRSYYHARVDLANKIRQQIKDAGFTNVSLGNPNGYKF